MARPGDTVVAGVILESTSGWHTYWRNPGESGLATTIDWALPAGITAGEILWPVPEEHRAGGYTTYVYHDKAMLLVPLNLSSNVPAGRYDLRARVAWLECKDSCVPGESNLAAQLVVGTLLQPSPASGEIAKWKARIPRAHPGLKIASVWRCPATTNLNDLLITVAGDDRFRPANFISYAIDGIEVQPPVDTSFDPEGTVRLIKKVKRFGESFPDSISGILWRAADGSTPPAGFEVTLRPRFETATAALTPGSDTAGGGPGARRGAGALATMLGLAFLGGIILNVMPCVLPVISLKILGFVQQSRESHGRVQMLGLLYGAGVVVSFLVLAGVVIGVQEAGGAASWGMQMQNPYFRLALLLVVTLVALNLFGLFEVYFGGVVANAASGLAATGGTAGAFFNGVLATALATPCTAPFLTAALGFAFAQSSPYLIVLTFLFVALGLAAPYVVLSWKPGWLRFLPKPGPWMQRFKVAMGFPMMATAVWLFDLTAPSFGEGGILWLGLLLVVVAAGAWAWGEFVQHAGGSRSIRAAGVLGLSALACLAVLEGPLDWRHLSAKTDARVTKRARNGGIDWQPWTREAVDRARAEGRAVFVDFTARWCLTCKSNEKFAIEVEEVRAKLKSMNALALKADNTDSNPEITAELRRHGRAGVPLVVVYPRRPDRDPIVLPTVLTPGLVIEALNRAGE